MDQSKIDAFNQEQQRLKDEQASTDVQANQAERIARSVTNSGSAVAGVVSGTGARNEKATKEVGNAVNQVGHDIVEAVSQSQNEVAQALNNLVVATVVSKDPQLIQAAKDVAGLLTAVAQAGNDFKGSKLNLLPVANEKLAASIDKLANSVQEAPDKDYSPQLADILTQLKKLDTKPVINIPKADVAVDLSPLLEAINQLKQTVKDSAVEIPVDDDTDILMGLQAVKQSLDSLVFPVPNYVLPFKDASGKATQQVVVLPTERLFERVSNTDGSATAFSTFGATIGKKSFIRGYSITNTSPTNGYVDFRDDVSGSVLWTVPIPANGGANVMLEEPIFWSSTNTALAYDVSAALTTVFISITGYQQ